ncbi:MAG: conjugal transfer protein TraL [Oscillospiraceae bacterium]|nr:conjugal transfer protein TraL [Oscillospiraceae bacterium]
MRKTASFSSVLVRYAAPILSAAAAARLLYGSGEKILRLDKFSSPADAAVLAGAFFLVFCLSLLLPVFTGYVRTFRGVLFCALPAALMLFLRVLSLSNATPDYIQFLSQWVSFFRTHGGFSALGSIVGDYNFPYLYFTAAISYLNLPDLYLIKLFSILFDVIAAWGGLKLTECLLQNGLGHPQGDIPSVPSRKAPLAAYFVLLLLPTVILNGAYWGQCDSIYAAFALFSIYFALSNRPLVSVALMAAAFAFKLQAVFVMPLFLVLLLIRKIRLRHLFLFPVVYLLFCIPALAAGRPFSAVWDIYLSQTGSYNSRLTLNAPSAMALLPQNADVELWHKIGIAAAFLFVLLLLVYLFRNRKTVSTQTLFLATLLFSLGIPLLLPHMHERYFFLFETLSVVYACAVPKRFYLPILAQGASLNGYCAYLGNSYAYPLKWSAVLLIAIFLVVLFDFWKQMQTGKPQPGRRPGAAPS